jgi:hypothetical protein
MWHQGYGPAPWTMVVMGGAWLALVVAGVGVAVWFLAQRGHRLVPVRPPRCTPRGRSNTHRPRPQRALAR